MGEYILSLQESHIGKLGKESYVERPAREVVWMHWSLMVWRPKRDLSVGWVDYHKDATIEMPQ